MYPPWVVVFSYFKLHILRCWQCIPLLSQAPLQAHLRFDKWESQSQITHLPLLLSGSAQITKHLQTAPGTWDIVRHVVVNSLYSIWSVVPLQSWGLRFLLVFNTSPKHTKCWEETVGDEISEWKTVSDSKWTTSWETELLYLLFYGMCLETFSIKEYKFF